MEVYRKSESLRKDGKSTGYCLRAHTPPSGDTLSPGEGLLGRCRAECQVTVSLRGDAQRRRYGDRRECLWCNPLLFWRRMPHRFAPRNDINSERYSKEKACRDSGRPDRHSSIFTGHPLSMDSWAAWATRKARHTSSMVGLPGVSFSIISMRASSWPYISLYLVWTLTVS